MTRCCLIKEQIISILKALEADNPMAELCRLRGFIDIHVECLIVPSRPDVFNIFGASKKLKHPN